MGNSEDYGKLIAEILNFLENGTITKKCIESTVRVAGVPECDLDDVLNEITTRYDEMTKGLKTE
jgi:molybdopterin-biosynthesis enzyme MoeA-like protein